MLHYTVGMELCSGCVNPTGRFLRPNGENVQSSALSLAVSPLLALPLVPAATRGALNSEPICVPSFAPPGRHPAHSVHPLTKRRLYLLLKTPIPILPFLAWLLPSFARTPPTKAAARRRPYLQFPRRVHDLIVIRARPHLVLALALPQRTSSVSCPMPNTRP